MAGVEDSEVTQLGTLKVPEPAARPDVLDILIAGGGPAGTAAAFRAKELGLSSLVIDADDLLTKIRDFPEKKHIEPDYGRGAGGKPFPPGGPLVTALHFDTWLREEMLEKWRGYYKNNSIAARIGAELTGLERQSDGTWLAKTWSRRGSQEISYRTRNVLLAVGGNVARSFDIPGDLAGVNFRLDKAENFCGGPALVVGGGISAAECVIAISGAKAKGGDKTAVYWSYHGEALPKVAESKALAERFYDAYVGNGNIRYLSRSAPAAIFTGPDKLDYLSVRVDRKIIEGRPIESVHLEFLKERVIACIGADLPFQLIEGIGAKVPRVNDQRYMLINHDGELSLPNVFLAGDARGAKFLRCTDFNDQETWEWIQGPAVNRNIKNAMWEAILAVETIAVRAGRADAKVALLAAPALTGKKLDAKAAAAKPAAAAAPAAKPAPAAAAPAAAAPAAKPAPPPSVVTPAQPEQAAAQQAAIAQLESLLPDGTVESEFPLTKPSTTIGRSGADISSPGDVNLSALHATVSQRGDDFVLDDSGSSTGTWLRVQGIEGRPLAEGDLIWLGSQILMATKADGGWAVAHYDSQGNYKSSYPVPTEKGIFIGRGAGIPLDEHDGSLSRRHAQFRVDAQGLKVFDLASKNGTLLKLTGAAVLRDGDEFRVGNHRYRFDRLQEVSKLKPTDVVVEEPAPAPAAAPAAAAPAAAAPAAAAPAAAPAGGGGGGGLMVNLDHAQFAASFMCGDGQSILNGYFDYVKGKGGDPDKQHKKPLDWACLSGSCGLCVVKVVEGADNIEPAASPKELDTLENKAFVDPDPKQFRLACLSKIKGPVKLGIVEE
jgi:pSer/pThr/pTyr-binding forkhead associated (FHA) protein/thioredoxin reductase/ferredoxin